jgi:hypothetical protein
MKMKKWEAIYMPSSNFRNPSKGGFDSQSEAWDYAASKFCNDCKKLYDNGEGSPCDAEWIIDDEE